MGGTVFGILATLIVGGIVLGAAGVKRKKNSQKVRACRVLLLPCVGHCYTYILTKIPPIPCSQKIMQEAVSWNSVGSSRGEEKGNTSFTSTLQWVNATHTYYPNTTHSMLPLITAGSSLLGPRPALALLMMQYQWTPTPPMRRCMEEPSHYNDCRSRGTHICVR